MKVSYDQDMMQLMKLFDAVTHVSLKDCFESEGILFFIVPEGHIGKAVGSGGKNILRLREKFNKKIKVVEFNTNPIKFLINLLYPIKIEEVSNEEGILTISSHDHKSRGLIIGRNAQNLRNTEKILMRYFPIKEIKIEK